MSSSISPFAQAAENACKISSVTLFLLTSLSRHFFFHNDMIQCMWTEKQVHFILLLVDQFGYTLMTLHDQASSTPARALPAEADFLPPLQRDRKVSLERQLVQALRAAIVSGRLRPGMRLPSSRCLAAELHINRNTIVNALEQLIAEDYLTGKVGAGTFVNHHLMV